MANRIDGFIVSRGKYPWNDWMDGTYWRIYKGEDYMISTHNMQISLHGRARAKGFRVTTNAFIESAKDNHGWVYTREGLVFQFKESE